MFIVTEYAALTPNDVADGLRPLFTRKKNLGPANTSQMTILASHRRTVKTLASLRIRAVELKSLKREDDSDQNHAILAPHDGHG